MNIYQIRNGDLYYRRGNKGHSGWFEPDKASVWTNLKGATCALNQIHRRGETGEIVEMPVLWPRITLVKCDDWQALYADDKLVCQGHRLDADRALKEIGFRVRTVPLDPNYMLGKPSLPDNLDDL